MLFFAGNAKLKPFVPTESGRLSKPSKDADQPALSESLMTNASKDGNQFDFMKDTEGMKQWEANQEEIDRQWYDTEEDGRMRDADDYMAGME